MILRWKKIHGLSPSGDSNLCDHFAMVTWEFIERIAPGRNLPYEVFFVHLWYIYVLSKKNLNAFTKDCFKASDFRISSVRPDSSEFRIEFHPDFDFHKIKKKSLFGEKFLRLIFDNLKRHTLQAGFGRLPSVDLNCVHFWNLG